MEDRLVNHKTTDYKNTIIAVAEDCPAVKAEIPPNNSDEMTIARMQYEIIMNHPYTYTSDDVIFQIYALKKKIPKKNIKKERDLFFSKGQPCMRSSPLARRYGWGIHSNSEGKVAIYAVESEEYKKLSLDKTIGYKKAMRAKRA